MCDSAITRACRAGTATPFGRKCAAQAIHDFCRLHPGVAFDLRLSDQAQNLYSCDLDLAIRMGELADSRLVARSMADTRRILAASPDYLKAHGQPAQPSGTTEERAVGSVMTTRLIDSLRQSYFLQPIAQDGVGGDSVQRAISSSESHPHWGP